MLNGMGFPNIHLAQSGTKAFTLIKGGGFDFAITDWHLKEIDGISLTNRIRRDPHSPNPTMPVIMLTGRMERSDVELARDQGVHEYVVKPFSARTIYKRLERIVEFPRYFVVGKDYIGPDRRNKNSLIEIDRRKKPMVPRRKPWDTAKDIRKAEASPKLWLPDFSMKHKLSWVIT
jgi:two-component system chemotaxis response regulator CheY